MIAISSTIAESVWCTLVRAGGSSASVKKTWLGGALERGAKSKCTSSHSKVERSLRSLGASGRQVLAMRLILVWGALWCRYCVSFNCAATYWAIVPYPSRSSTKAACCQTSVRIKSPDSFSQVLRTNGQSTHLVPLIPNVVNQVSGQWKSAVFKISSGMLYALYSNGELSF